MAQRMKVGDHRMMPPTSIVCVTYPMESYAMVGLLTLIAKYTMGGSLNKSLAEHVNYSTTVELQMLMNANVIKVHRSKLR